LDTIFGYLERISYYNEESQFTVAKIKEKDKKELTTIVGCFSGINPGESLRLHGKWVFNNKFGQQFQVEGFETVVPATVNGIEKYLGSGLIKGIGPVMAKRIVRIFGLETIEIISSRPEELSRVEGIGSKRIAMIAQAWAEQKEIKEIMIFLQGHGVSASYSSKIYKKYQDKSIEIVSNNPYILAADISGIGFVTADKIAQSLGFDSLSVVRAKEGIIYTLTELMSSGHVYLPEDELLEKSGELLNIKRDIVEEALAGLVQDKRIITEVLDPREGDLSSASKAVYLPPFFIAEVNLARDLIKLNSEPVSFSLTDTEKVLDQVEGSLGIKLASNQRDAVNQALRNKVLVITGGPGTGKTTIIKAIVKIFQNIGKKVLLAAPTGRAAKRMQEATGWEAKTIHRMLEFSYQGGGFQRNRDFPLDGDVVIIDEVSMIDTLLMYNLTKAVPGQSSLILVGDINQLPSVGPGNILSDIIDSKRIKVVTLVEIFRQAAESRIITNAHRIIQGELPDLLPTGDGRDPDFYFVPEEDPGQAVEKIVALCTQRIPKHFGFHPVEDIQVLTPMHRGEVGVANLNIMLQQRLNPDSPGVEKGYRGLKVKDKVMQTINNYDKDVYNGDIGRVAFIDKDNQLLTVDFDGRRVVYQFNQLEELILAYAISIHKSQGSEYPAVIIPVMTQHYLLLQRNLIYTAITRGKKLVVLVGSKKALAIAIKNVSPGRRNSLLTEKMAAMASTAQQPGDSLF
jgi:exodeoxyribonuclease V alpha subunit